MKTFIVALYLLLYVVIGAVVIRIISMIQERQTGYHKDILSVDTIVILP